LDTAFSSKDQQKEKENTPLCSSKAPFQGVGGNKPPSSSSRKVKAKAIICKFLRLGRSPEE